jgi:fluoride exporter
MMLVLGIAVAAAIAAPMRMIIERRITDLRDPAAFPWGLIVVNLTGAALAGAILASTTGDLRIVLIVGLCGTYTTFSGFAFVAVSLARRSTVHAAAFVSATVLGSVAAFLIAQSAFG